jgi:NAD-dependent SIR2 family protein deacetylase
MFICLDCGATFEEPKHFVEKHGLDTPPYEHFNGCPVCGGAYDEAVECDRCGELVPSDTVVKFEGDLLCEACWGRLNNDG